MHINPPWLPEPDDGDYWVGQFALLLENEISPSLSKKCKQDLLSQAIGFINSGVPSERDMEENLQTIYSRKWYCD
jgi:hypothetical protein